MGVGRKKKDMGLAALAGETAKMAKQMMVLDKTEAALEKELLKEEQRVEPTSKIGKVRRKGESMLHAKYLLLMVVILNVIDCLLVLGELMLDIKYVTDLLTKEYERSEGFVGTMRGLYPARLGYLALEDIALLEHDLLVAYITWDDHDNGYNTSVSQSGAHSNTGAGHDSTTQSNIRNRRSVSNSSDVIDDINSNGTQGNGTDLHGLIPAFHNEHAHSLEEVIAHALHKASITILGILVVETLFKIFCLGKEMLEHKLECFDSFIVVVSFIVDLVFLKGLQQFTVQEFVLILAFMVPWRIIRVVNSLVVAIMDHEHFRLKILYQQKKKITNELKDSKDEIKGLEACIGALEKMCSDAGLPDYLVTAKLNMFRKVKAKANTMGAMTSFAIGGEAMTKPFINGATNNNADVVIPMDGDTPKAGAEKLDNVLTEVPTVTDLVEKAIEITGSSAQAADRRRRPRSVSAIELSEKKKADRDSLLVRKLAENSAGFIATINKDDIDIRAFNRDSNSSFKTDPIPEHDTEEAEEAGEHDKLLEEDAGITIPEGSATGGTSKAN